MLFDFFMLIPILLIQFAFNKLFDDKKSSMPLWWVFSGFLAFHLLVMAASVYSLQQNTMGCGADIGVTYALGMVCVGATILLQIIYIAYQNSNKI
jgi:hypothetical protein